MINQERISSLQIIMLMIPAVCATAILIVPGITGQYAKSDMWMSPIFASIAGYASVYVAWKLHQLYPKLTPIQYSEKILGKVMGRALGLVFVVFYIHCCGIALREYSEFIKGNVLVETPRSFIAILTWAVCAFAVRAGIETLARAAIILTTLFMLPSIILLLLAKDLDINNILPILENGLGPVLKGGIVPSSWFTEFFLIAFLLPFLSNQKKGLKAGMISVVFIMITLVYCNFIVLALFGGEGMNELYPIYSAVRYISAFNFFENFEAAIMSSWVLGNFVKLSVYLFVASLGISQLLRLSDYKDVVFPIALICIFFDYWDMPNMAVLEYFSVRILPFYLISLQLVIPIILLVVAKFRLRR